MRPLRQPIGSRHRRLLECWLEPRTTAEHLQRAMAQAREDFTGCAVSTRVNDVHNNDEGLIDEVEQAQE
ncbi:hypothetical protein D3C80_1937370 [compost metagenome]